MNLDCIAWIICTFMRNVGDYIVFLKRDLVCDLTFLRVRVILQLVTNRPFKGCLTPVVLVFIQVLLHIRSGERVALCLDIFEYEFAIHKIAVLKLII